MCGDSASVVERERRFEFMYQAHYQSIYNYAVRRVISAQEAVDVVSDVFTTAWRRVDDVPLPPEERLWLYGVARRVLSQHRRSSMRRGRLLDRMKAGRESVPSDSASEHHAQDRILEAMAKLRPDDCEALRLVLWEELSHADAGRVLDCSANAVAIRVHRAKVRLREILLAEDIDDLPNAQLHRPTDPRELNHES